MVLDQQRENGKDSSMDSAELHFPEQTSSPSIHRLSSSPNNKTNAAPSPIRDQMKIVGDSFLERGVSKENECSPMEREGTPDLLRKENGSLKDTFMFRASHSGLFTAGLGGSPDEGGEGGVKKPSNILMQSTGGLIRRQLDGVGRVSLAQHRRDIFRLKEEKEIVQAEYESLKDEYQDLKMEHEKLLAKVQMGGMNKAQKQKCSSPAEVLEIAELEAHLEAKESLVASLQQQLQAIPRLQRQVEALTSQLEEERSMATETVAESQQLEVCKVMKELEKQGELHLQQMHLMREQISKMSSLEKQLQISNDERTRLELQLTSHSEEAARCREAARRSSVESAILREEMEVLKRQLSESIHKATPLATPQHYNGTFCKVNGTVEDAEEAVCLNEINPLTVGSAKLYFMKSKGRVEEWLNNIEQEEEKEDVGEVGEVGESVKRKGLNEGSANAKGSTHEGNRKISLECSEAESNFLALIDYQSEEGEGEGVGDVVEEEKVGSLNSVRVGKVNLKDVVDFFESRNGEGEMEGSGLDRNKWSKEYLSRMVITVMNELIGAAEKLEEAELHKRLCHSMREEIDQGRERELTLACKLTEICKKLEVEVVQRERYLEVAAEERREEEKRLEEWKGRAEVGEAGIANAVKKCLEAEMELEASRMEVKELLERIRVLERERPRVMEELKAEAEREKGDLQGLHDREREKLVLLEQTLEQAINEREKIEMKLEEEEMKAKMMEGGWLALQERVEVLQTEVVVERKRGLQIEEALRQEELNLKQALADKEALAVVEEEKKALEVKCADLAARLKKSLNQIEHAIPAERAIAVVREVESKVRKGMEMEINGLKQTRSRESAALKDEMQWLKKRLAVTEEALLEKQTRKGLFCQGG